MSGDGDELALQPFDDGLLEVAELFGGAPGSSEEQIPPTSAPQDTPPHIGWHPPPAGLPLPALAKVLFYLWLARGTSDAKLPEWPWLLSGFALALFGTWLGRLLLNRMSDRSSLRWTRWLITAIGAAYLLQALRLFAA